MLSNVIVGVLQQRLIDRFPRFAYWIYSSEAVAAGLVAVVLSGQGSVFFAGGALYSLDSVHQVVGYEKKRRKKTQDVDWDPPRWARIAAYAFFVLLVGFGLWLALAGLGTIVILIAVAVIAAGLLEIYTVWTTGWCGFIAWPWPCQTALHYRR